DYFTHRANEDIKNYLATVPADAVYQRCNLQRELVDVMHYCGDYSFSECKEILLSVRNSYESNGLMIQAMRTAISLADECFWEGNLDEELMPRNMDDLNEAMDYADKILSTVLLHPDCADCFAQMAWMSLRLHQYDHCVRYVNQFNKCNIKEAHYAPWFQYSLWASRLILRVREIEKCINSIKESAEKLQDLPANAREWLKRYPNPEDDYDTVLLWGSLLGYDPVFVKQKCWIGQEVGGQAKIKNHHWLCIQEFDPANKVTQTVLELDLLYPQINPGPPEKILFVVGMHPLESGRDVGLRQDQENSHIIVQNVLRSTRKFPTKDRNGNTTILEQLRAYITNALEQHS
ncbi:MAG: hypothetical protein LUH19_04660, partial [Lachnospiraceae bacterium]|nr:hypothetical protein [Lachnospiraceae bacterium]